MFQISVAVELFFTMKLLESRVEPPGASDTVVENRLFDPRGKLDNGNMV